MNLWGRSSSRRLQVRGAHGMLPATLLGSDGNDSSADNLLVFLHAGNFISRSFERIEDFYHSLREAVPSLSMLVPSYTLATVSPFPTALEDTYNTLLWAKSNQHKLGWNGKHLIVAGIEAGANLAAAVTLACRDRQGPHIDGQILLTPMLDPAFESRSMQESVMSAGQFFAARRSATGFHSYLPNPTDRKHPYATPLHATRLHNLPRTLIFSAEGDPLRDEAEAYGQKLIAHGVRTSVVRLQRITLESQDARTRCCTSDQVIDDISGFVARLTGPCRAFAV